MRKKLLLIGLSALVLLVVGVGAKVLVLDARGADEDELARAPGPVYAMDQPFVVNLADGGDIPRFAKVGVAMRLSELSAGELVPGSGDAPATVEDDAELRDIVISTLQRRTSAQLATPRGRSGVKREIRARVNGETDLSIVDVYYTEFAVQ